MWANAQRDGRPAEHILLSDSANCAVLRAVVLTQYWRVTDGQTDRRTDGQTGRIAVASTALAMLALRRAVINGDVNTKITPTVFNGNNERRVQSSMSNGLRPPVNT